MPCRYCRQTGHNFTTCPQRRAGLPSHTESRRTARPSALSSNIAGVPLESHVTLAPPPTPPTHPPPPPLVLVPFVQPSLTSEDYRKHWKNAFVHHKLLNRFKKCTAIRVNRLSQGEDISSIEPMVYITHIVYFAWLKVKDIFKHKGHLGEIKELIEKNWAIIALCTTLHSSLNPKPAKFNVTRSIEIVNMKSENYLIYWVLGNYLIQDMDEQENPVKYMGMVNKMCKFLIDTMDGHRFYIVPHRLDIEPPYHPNTDKQFFIEPYCQINIHDKSEKMIYIDNKEGLSEMNRWKFNALKLDFLIKQVIQLGGKNNDVLESVLDLHQDITLDDVSEIEKDYAGIPSSYTNIT